MTATAQRANDETSRAVSLAEEIAQLQADAHRIGAAAEREGDKRIALMYDFEKSENHR